MILDLPPELLNTIFHALDDRSRINLVSTCTIFRIIWTAKAWGSLTLTGPKIKSQLNRLVSWTRDSPKEARERTRETRALHIWACLLQDDVPLALEGQDNTDIVDEDIYPLLDWLCSSLETLSIDLPPTHSQHFFDITLSSISELVNLERLFLGRVKVDDGYELERKYSGLKEATMIWCHGIVEQKLLVGQPQLEHLDVHDSWDIGNLSQISHQWHNLKSFRFSAVDPGYAIRIFENAKGAMTSLQNVSLEVPMSEFVFRSIITHLADYPIRRFHLSLSSVGLGVFTVNPSGQNKVPDAFSPDWLRVISLNLKHLEELVLDYRGGGVSLDLVWPGEQAAYLDALTPAKKLHTLAISIHAISQNGRGDCRDLAYNCMECIPSLQEVHFPAMPRFPPYMFQLSCPDRDIPQTYHVGYSLFRISGESCESPPDGDYYLPFWISHGTDVAIDRHRRAGGLPIVASDSDETYFDFDFTDELFNEDDLDLALWLHDNQGSSDSEVGDVELEYPVETPEDWMGQLIVGMSNVGVAQLDLSALDEYVSDGGYVEDQDNDTLLEDNVEYWDDFDLD